MPRPRRRPAIMRNVLLFISAVEVSALAVRTGQNPATSFFRRHNGRHRRRFELFASDQNDDKSPSAWDAATHPATMNTALCVVPPEDAWDNIQRARHVARDATYQLWPPAIRLFHPFCPPSLLSDMALDIAELVEKHKIEPFSVVLDTWTIVPHMEQIEADLEAMRELPSSYEEEKTQTNKTAEPSEIDRLIEKEELIGKQRLKMRATRKKDKERSSTSQPLPVAAEDGKGGLSEKRASPRDLLEKQKRMYETFNGPCVVCLEPNEESKHRLIELRDLMRLELLESYDGFSPSSSVSSSDTLPRAVRELEEMEFRPLVSVGSFPTVTSAIETARKLKGLWHPLTFNVTEFHLISHEGDRKRDRSSDEFSDNREYMLTKTSWLNDQAKEKSLTAQGQYGCDALVMLMGEELVIDDEDSQDMVDLIMQQGRPGGFDCAQDEEMSLSLNKASEDLEEGMGNLEEWLDADDEHDEGSVVVIGRTHLFSGEQREYVGMPASSMVDAKDRNNVAASVSGTARRRAAAHRQAGVGTPGEFGRKKSDYIA